MRAESEYGNNTRIKPSPSSSLFFLSLTRRADAWHADINIPWWFALFFGWKFYKKTKMWKPHEMDFVTGIPTVEETEVPEVKPTTFLGKVAAVLF